MKIVYAILNLIMMIYLEVKIKKVLEIFKFNNTEANLKERCKFLNSTKEDPKFSGAELISKKDYDILNLACLIIIQFINYYNKIII